MTTSQHEWWGMLATGPAGPPPLSGYYGDAPINVTLTADSFGTTPDPVADTWHNGTTPGTWQPDTSGSTETSGVVGTYQITINGNAHYTGPDGGTVRVQLELGFGGPRVDLLNSTMNNGDTLPFSYSAIHTGLGSISLPVWLQSPFPHTANVTFTGSATFTWVP